jgi:hypothetical protein
VNGEPYSRNTFEDFAKVRHYVSVRLKQGVPLVDADINELEDLRRYELRNFLRWFVGDGTPSANSGFRIMPSGAPNDVVILGGDGTPEGSGRCLVDGMEALNPADVRFSAQEFSDPEAAARAGVSPVTMPVTPPAGERTDLYFLDVWEREITSAELGHEDIVDNRIGIESARRIRREWAVRVVAETAGVPANDTPPGHRYLPLARVLRTTGQDVITDGNIVDLRRRGVLMPARTTFDQITADAFGSSYPLGDDGLPRLAIPLRDVLNAMLRDGRPAVVGPQLFQQENGPHNFPASVVDAGGSQWVFWLGQSGSTVRFFFQRQLGGIWTPPTAAFDPTGTVQESLAVAAAPDGAIWLAYSSRVSGQFRILLRRFFNGAWEPEITVSDTGSNQDAVAAVDTDGNLMVAWRQVSTGNVLARPFIGTNPQPIVTAASGGTAPARITLLPGAAGTMHLYTVETGAGPDWAVQTKSWQGAAWSAYTPVATIPVTSFVEFSAARDRTGNTWLIWTTELSTGVSVLRARRVTQSAVEDVLQWATGSPRQPAALRDSHDNLQLFFRNDTHLDMVNVIFEV